MADSENSRTLPKISCANEFPNETFVDRAAKCDQPAQSLPLAARILPMLLNDLPSRAQLPDRCMPGSCGRDWYDRYQQRQLPSVNAGILRRGCWKRPAVVLPL